MVENGRVLLAQRKKDAQLALKWEFPGGKIEPGETPEDCLARELKEELNMDVAVLDLFTAVAHSYGTRNILLLAYFCRRLGGVPMLRQCNDFSWVEIADIMKYDLAEADLPIAIKLQGEKKNHA
ncbi:MAG: NUDIX hydrolase [Peptococcaceae bacterium BRH_c4b]|nr:MAG: NUDIX hydrolase [Peptococcaceae bacterium BRH_c4b]